jgi:shikimate kinase
MTTHYQSIILCGFRACGTSTIGKLLSEKLEWRFIEMDEEIIKATKINYKNQEITSQEFRQLETHLLQELLEKKHVVIAAGAGVGVNNVVKDGSKITFGELQRFILKHAPCALIVRLDAPEETIIQRLRTDEMSKRETTRPILKEKKAKQIKVTLSNAQDDPQRQKELLIQHIIENALETYRTRKSFYEQLTPHVLNTGKLSAERIVERIMLLLKNL